MVERPVKKQRGKSEQTVLDKHDRHRHRRWPSRTNVRRYPKRCPPTTACSCRFLCKHTHTHTFLDSLSGHARAPGARARTLIRTLSKLCLYSFNEACTHMQRCWAPVPEHRPEFVTVLPILESIKAQHPVPPSPYLTASPSPIKQNGFDQPQVRTCKCQIFALCMLICGGFVG
jgi:hypothetical protein